ncbi:MAG: hypothetical protein K1X47_11215 [Cyclobacteriaceae bacterium]|nr:hypothetical protein [Cyclobacteriaceae bacterium]
MKKNRTHGMADAERISILVHFPLKLSMHFLKQTVITVVICLILQAFLPWWTMIVGAAFVGRWQGIGAVSSFGAGFVATGFIWLLAVVYMDSSSQALVATRLEGILGAGNPFLIMTVTTLIGGFTGGFAALTGWSLKSTQ